MRVVNFTAIASGVHDYTNDEIHAAIDAGDGYRACNLGDIPLVRFALLGNTEMVSLLLSHGVGPHQLDACKSALHCAIFGNHMECAVIILQHGLAPSDCPLHTRGYSSFRMLTQRLRHASRAIGSILCRKFRVHLGGVPKDLMLLLAHEMWSNRYDEKWEME